MNVVAIVLAAGASLRMGQTKQLLPYNGQSLLLRAVNSALDSDCGEVIVVLGANADQLQSEISETGARAVINYDWEEGMGSSIRCGLNRAEGLQPEASAVLLMLCDQPLIQGQSINRLIDGYRKTRPLIAASEYETGGDFVRGVPAIFSRAVFPELGRLSGTAGAKSVITRHKDQVLFVPVPEAALDLDTLPEYELAVSRQATFGARG
jgi:molybdenum cofactor cytidylyltransferase